MDKLPEPCVRIGIIGVGFMGLNHLQNLLTLQNVKVMGVTDSSKEKGEAAARRFGVPFFADIPSLLEQLDAVVITVPTTAHYEVTRLAVEHNIHVFVEKPFMHNMEEARSICELIKRHPVKVQVGHVERYQPVIQKSWEVINWDQLVALDFTRNIPLRKQIDVDVVLAVMVHDVDLMLQAVKIKNTKVLAFQALGTCSYASSLRRNLIDTAFVQAQLADGTVTRLMANRAGALSRREVYFTEVNRTIIANLLDNRLTIIHRRNKQSYDIEKTVLQMPAAKPLLNEMRSFIQAILTGREPEVNQHDGIAVMELTEQIRAQIYRKHLT